MWCSGVAGLLTRLAFQKSRRGVSRGWGKRKSVWSSYALSIIYSAAVYLPLWAAGFADFHANALDRFAGDLHMAQSPRFLIVIAYFVSGSFGMFASGIGTAGEELGWRGFLVPELAKVTSFTRLSVISGAIWPAWHIPVLVGADYRGAGPVRYSIVCFVLLVLGASFLFAWMRLKSGRVWTGMLLHANHNLFVQLIFDQRNLRH